MSDSPLISVVIPTFHSERWIAETISSVLAQTLGDFEIVVSDNSAVGATATEEIVRGFDDARIGYVRSEPVGAVPNWNAGMARARGRYVKLLCADDLLYPTCLERQAAVLDAEPGVALVTSVHDVVDERGERELVRGFKREGRMPGREAIRRMARSGTNLVGEPSITLFRRETYEAVGPWFEPARYVVDVDMWTKLLLAGDLYVLGETLSAFRVQRDSWSNALTHSQTSDFAALLDRLADDERTGVGRADALLGRLGAWRNAQLRRVFYRVFLREADLTRFGD